MIYLLDNPVKTKGEMWSCISVVIEFMNYL